MSFVIGQFRAIESLDAESRHPGVERLRGEDLTTGLEVAMTVLSTGSIEDAMVAVTGVRDVQHPHLLPVSEVIRNKDRLAVVCRWPPGGRLADLLDRRNTLTIGETLTVLIPLAAALTAIHAAGARHGDVGPSTIWFDPAGRPMLGAVGAAAAVLATRGGLPCEIRDVAPEVVRGERPAGRLATSAADVFSLGSVALRCLSGRPAWPADDPADVLVQSAAGLWPDPPEDAGPPVLLALVRAMLRSDAALRPTASEVVAGLAGIGGPEPVSLGPVRAALSSRRWRGWGDPDGPGAAQKPDAGRAPGEPAGESGAAAASLADEQPAAKQKPPPTDVGLPPPGRWARAGVVALVGLLAVVVAVQVGLWWTGRDQPGASIVDEARGSVTGSPDQAADWLQVVTDLDVARARAFAAADTSALSEVYLPRSAPALADAATIENLAARGWTVPNGTHEIAGVTMDPGVTPGAPGAGGVAANSDGVRLAVLDSLPARPIIDSSGQQVGLTAARPEQQRILTVIATAEGYRISEVQPG